MKILIFLLFLFFFTALINSRKISWRRPWRRWCRYGYHYRFTNNGRYKFKRFHACMCPKLKCQKIKKCKYGVPFVEESGGCKSCPQCRKRACPKIKIEKNCAKVHTYMSQGCKMSYCKCYKRRCAKLKTKCSLGTVTPKDWRGCDKCPQCKCKISCPRLRWWQRESISRRCKNGTFTPPYNKEGCPTGCFQCRKKPCKKLKCKECEYGIKKWSDKFDNQNCPTTCPICREKPKNCPKRKCKKLKCSLGTVTRRDWRGCDLCPVCKCKKLTCPAMSWWSRRRMRRNCKNGAFTPPYDKEGCATGCYQCRKKPCKDLKCKPCKYGVSKYVYKYDDQYCRVSCNKCRKKPCKDLKCKQCQNGVKQWNNKYDAESCATGCNECCADLKCPVCKYGIKQWNNKYDKHWCATGCNECNPKPKCPKLKNCKKLKCSLGIQKHISWNGCQYTCPTCKCPVNNWNLKCKFGRPYGKYNKEGCYIYKCRKTACPKKEKPKKKCDSLWWSHEKGCRTKAHCWINPCNKYKKCPKVNCSYGVFEPRDPKNGCDKCHYCERDPKDIEIENVEKSMLQHHKRFVQLIFKLQKLKQ